VFYTIQPYKDRYYLFKASLKGVVFIAFAKNLTELTPYIQEAVPLLKDVPAFEWWEAFDDWLEHRRPSLDILQDIQGTDFQQKVWQALATIPYGQCVSYSELAKQIGHPTAVRAVASACAKNPVAVLVPCHRVIGKRQGLSGYRWGLDLKESLLQEEGGCASKEIHAFNGTSYGDQ
jgi:AraC family transcriptional regulator of adaptative response/methylated-DNA-[protein]-cysteine methyltransferase